MHNSVIIVLVDVVINKDVLDCGVKWVNPQWLSSHNSVCVSYPPVKMKRIMSSCTHIYLEVSLAHSKNVIKYGYIIQNEHTVNAQKISGSRLELRNRKDLQAGGFYFHASLSEHSDMKDQRKTMFINITIWC